MQAVIFVGLQASGKSSFFKERFFTTHVRISLDLLKTRNRERMILAACLQTNQPFVVDNTNVTSHERSVYITAARQAGYSVVGYYFRSRVQECLLRNKERFGCVPEVAILATAKKLELPSLAEGFDDLNYVCVTEPGFCEQKWQHEV